LERALPGFIAYRAIQGVVQQKKLERRLPSLDRNGGNSVHHHAFGHARVAPDGEGIAVGAFDFHHASAAVSIYLEVTVVAEMLHRYTMRPANFQDVGALGGFVDFPVNRHFQQKPPSRLSFILSTTLSPSRPNPIKTIFTAQTRPAPHSTPHDEGRIQNLFFSVHLEIPTINLSASSFVRSPSLQLCASAVKSSLPLFCFSRYR
jgi:hypothetical protein